MAATLPRSSSQSATSSEPQSWMMDKETAEKLNNEIEDELKVRNILPKSFFFFHLPHFE